MYRHESFFELTPQLIDLGTIFNNKLAYMVESWGPVYPEYQSSLNFLKKAEELKLMHRLVEIENSAKYNPFSHSVVTTKYAVDVASALNNISTQSAGFKIVDLPLLTVATAYHDIGNVIDGKDIQELHLDKTDLIPLFRRHPIVTKSKQIKVENFIRSTHIARSVALMLAFASPAHAETAAHGIYHLTDNKSDDGNQFPVSLERLILMLADYSVVDRPGSDKYWPKCRIVRSFLDRMKDAYKRHGGDLHQYQLQFYYLQSFKSFLEESGIYPPKKYKSQGKLDEVFIDIANYTNLMGIKRNYIPQINTKPAN
ncbi:hypothetical protein A3D05_01855 [Candidatus Gottesmanbacteria bacterium RIFCSPHIGHO2_02_FULL_40_24]|uniref:Uncharacterized protein n=1 Tax=Candidatus Gottesmanbacteria bacterium RIFCSPHIGHO2_01_FULL_40_15 TaxID=1798376 RepID=A0A1F5YZA2_9BACT|nr:MAG: hypothetical protein A2777_00260 [Candidatus Gottesmanbacteria bacterium RIFCSPHIGHO2_01_FULL_40_15]OGG18602.1 MAG: hypothetical protein A3D05_01855 [Candidatus Gottesmanbacteria bacterium RIFCSPHIGHO2_02_FULL_40_24]OGG24916.1 MAG: hypothetical protein A3E42_02675 [Candidatus Gottesmanbacteria bacterium RIFCSPHIGHO2_12_FULL_40_13]OGG31741.1 MAG: hypothetical protein A3I80_00725 [Candidatus Gottesmanbacteria bacterium RIFCSPLOWO2_02_FULL_40_10]